MNTYINAKEFRNDDLSMLFGKDLISVEELVDKIYELLDEGEEIKNELGDTKNELYLTQQELKSAKLGFTPYD